MSVSSKLFLLAFACLPGLSFAQSGIDYLKILKNASDYNRHDSRKLPAFSYESANDSSLVKLRKKYNLDSVAGYSNEESKVLNLMHWVHNIINHEAIAEVPIKYLNADSIITLTKQRGVSVTCKELATVLNDCYLAMGFKSRKVYCYPRDSSETDADFHVINTVYLPSLKKWILTDPTSDAYIMNRDGELLSIEEVRKSLINNRPLILNPEANLNRHESVTETEYDNYLEKNFYLFCCPLNSQYNYETSSVNKTATYIYLLPIDYNKTTAFHSEETDKKLGTTKIIYRTNNPDVFWQDPLAKDKNDLFK
ncbi:MAG TPA: transglutaminase-like domain-containing protein [Mucilaginibacter sp.]|jgi:transglutaminase-like putative cysteine protease